jgi:hypothetical protein
LPAGEEGLAQRLVHHKAGPMLLLELAVLLVGLILAQRFPAMEGVEEE